jgi:hypothetical protein
MKRAIYLGIFLWLITTSAGCVSIEKIFYHEPHVINVWDAKKIHPFSDLSDRHRRLTLEQSWLINQIYGEEINHEGDLIVYYEARKRKGISGDRGNIFWVREDSEFGPMEILICTTSMRIDEIVIKNNPFTDEKSAIMEEFLEQFIGRSWDGPIMMAVTPTDLLMTPSRIRPIADAPRISQAVMDAVTRVLIFAKVLGVT